MFPYKPKADPEESAGSNRKSFRVTLDTRGFDNTPEWKKLVSDYMAARAALLDYVERATEPFLEIERKSEED